MNKTTRYLPLTAIAIYALISMFFSGTAFAGNLSRTKITELPSLVPNYGYTMSFVRTPGMANNIATLRVTQPVGINGCITITTPDTVSSIIGPTIKVIVSAPIVTIDKAPQYGNATCKRHSPTVTSDIVLNRDEIINRKVTKIEISGPGGSDRYDLYTDKNQMYLYKKMRDSKRGIDMRVDFFDDKYFFKPINSRTRRAPLTHWFIPENVVILSAPEATDSQNVAKEIGKLAAEQGLIRLEELLNGFEPSTTDKNTLYFVDQTGITAKSLTRDLDLQFGTVTATETFYGSNGPYERAKNLKVMARLPGTFE